MNVLLLYLLLLKATLTSFSGLASLPVIRADLVVHYHVMTDRELNAAVAAGRSGPGPLGAYVVSVGYFVAGTPGAVAGWAAMVTPALLILPMLQFLSRRLENRRVRGVLECVTLAGAGLLLASTVPLAQDAIRGAFPFALAATSFLLLWLTKIETGWVILGGAAAGLLAYWLG